MTSRANSMQSGNILTDKLKEERDKQREHQNNRKRSHFQYRHNTGTWNTNVTLCNCFKVILYIILYLFTGCYFILWIIACNDTNRCFKKKWKILNNYYEMPYRLVYNIIATLLYLFIIIICLIFLIKYLTYAHEKQIQEKIKKTVIKTEKALHQFNKQANMNGNSDMYQFFVDHYKHDKEKEDLFKLSDHKKLSTAKEEPNSYSCCINLLMHIQIIWIIATELFLSLFYIEYNEFNIIAMATLCYYIFSSILYFNINDSLQRDDINCNNNQTYNVIKSDQIFFGLGCIIKAFAIILPGICINICQKWKCVYNEFYSLPEISITFKGDKFENGSISDSFGIDQIKNKSENKAGNLTYIELRSVLNDIFIRVWIFILFSIEFIIFMVQPIINNDDYRDMLNDQYNCKCINQSCNCNEQSMTFFTINELILRLFVPITLMSTLILVISFEKRFYISRLDAIKYVISPSSIALIVLITLCELYWWQNNKDTIVTIWSIIFGVTAVLQLYIFIALLDIQDNAYRNRDRLYGFKKSQPLTYYIEGIIAIGIMIICLASFILEDNLNNGNLDQTYIIIRSSGILLFDLIEIIMLIPIRTIGISPKFKNHFKKKGKKKYLRTFRWICFLNICNIIYSIIFICDEFNNILYNYKILSTSTMRSAFTLSFGSVYFSIWGLSQLLPWIIPSDNESSILYTYNPAIDQNSDISYMTQYHQVDKSRLGINSNISNIVSPPPSNLLSDLDVSIKYNKSKTKLTDKKNKERKILKEKKINNSFDENEDVQNNNNSFGIEKYDDMMKMFKNDEKNVLDEDNDNLNQHDELNNDVNNELNK